MIMTVLLVCVCSVSYANGGSKPPHSDNEPQYYSFEDLRSGMRWYSFRFENANKPSNAMASLSYYLEYPMVAARNKKIQAAVAAMPEKFKVDTVSLYATWNDSVEIPVKWEEFRVTLKGDLLFSRANGKMVDFVKLFSNWTHVAIVYSPMDLTVLEASLDKGVSVDYAPSTHTKITYYTYKRINTIPYTAITPLVDKANTSYKGIPYLPKVAVTEPLTGFVMKWCNKDDLASMYCSKLVYNTYKSKLNTDTDRTVVDSVDLGRPIGGMFFSWIGVSPDDIYYSTGLGYDFLYSENLLNL
jgi:hypothetical protein